MENHEIQKTQDVPLSFSHDGKEFHGAAKPLLTSCRDGICYEFDVELEGEHLGTIYRGNDVTWTLQNIADQELVNKIGDQIKQWYD